MRRLPRKKIIFSLIGLVILVVAIPAGIFLVGKVQELREKALEPSATCFTEDPAFPDGYEYVPGAVDVWVLYSDAEGNEVGQISGVGIHAEALHNGANEIPGNPNWPRTEVDGPGCGFTADGTTDDRGFTHLEPLNCGHNNFAISAISGLPPNLRYIGASVDGSGLQEVDISNLDLENGTTNVVKLYYQPMGTSYPTPSYAYPSPSYAYPTPGTSYAYPSPSYAYPTPGTSYAYPTPGTSYAYPSPSYAYPTPYTTPVTSSPTPTASSSPLPTTSASPTPTTASTPTATSTSSSNTPSPTKSVSAATATPTAQLPVVGISSPTIGAVIFGFLLILGAVLLSF